jgi:ABC-type Fe3+/spermidine/putrescine transport system ATPase subunit
MSDWVAVMNHGKVVQWGTPWDVYYQPRTAFMAEFVGSVNLVRSRVISSGDGVVRVQLGKHGIDLPFRNETPQPIQSEVLLCIRPETLALASTGAEHPYGFIALPGEVVRRTFLGHLLRYTVRVDPSGGQAEGQEWLVDQPDPGGTCILDGPVTVLVNPRRIHAIPE